MPRDRVKLVRAALGNRGVLDVVQDLFGPREGPSSLTLAHPKYLRIRDHTNRFLRLLAMFADSPTMRKFPDARGHLDAYVGKLRENFQASFSAPDLEPYLAGGGDLANLAESVYVRVPPEEIKAFGVVFEAVKKCNVVNIAVVTGKNLLPHKQALADPRALDGHFLSATAGLSFAPLPDLGQMNFKQVYTCDRSTPADQKFVLLVLHKLHAVCHDVYEAVSSPDVDVNEFVEVVMCSIEEVKKHLPRCDQAFNKIAESVGMLRSNFGEYYKDYTISGSPIIIMENFVHDVSKSMKASSTVAAQFGRIIAHYRKVASQHAFDPKLQGIFSQVDKNFEMMKTEQGQSSEDSDAEAKGAAEEVETVGDETKGTADELKGTADELKADGIAETAGESRKGAEPTAKGRARRRRRKKDKHASAGVANAADAVDAVDASGGPSLGDALDEEDATTVAPAASEAPHVPCERPENAALG